MKQYYFLKFSRYRECCRTVRSKKGWAAIDQSTFLSLVSEQDVRESLKYMGLSADEPVTKSRGLEICQRGNIKAVLVGSVASLGSQYVIGLEALHCSGKLLASEQAQASSKEQVLDAVAKAASRIRERLGESLTSIRKFDNPLKEEATTSSVEALKAYNAARRAEWAGTGKELDAIPLFERAIELDQQFGAAYHGIAELYEKLGERERAADHESKAYNLRDRLSESERLAITSGYHRIVTGELDKEMQTIEFWRREIAMIATSTLGSAAKAMTRSAQCRQGCNCARLFCRSELGNFLLPGRPTRSHPRRRQSPASCRAVVKA